MAAIWILAISSQLLLVIKYSIALPSCSENVTKLQVCAIGPDFKGDFFLLCDRKKVWNVSILPSALATDFGHTIAKSLIIGAQIQIQIPIPNKY